MVTTLVPPAPADARLYEQVAERVTGLIRSGTLLPGQRVPSVRRLATQLDASISTILAAYRLLEDRGLIAARPQSGYYVRPTFQAAPPEPAMTRPAAQPTAVSVSDLVTQIFDAARRPDLVPLGAAVPSTSLLPLRQLTRLVSQMARRHPDQAYGYDFPPGCPQLRTQVARRMLEAGCAARPEDLVTTTGATEAVHLCLKAVTRPGDAVAIESPTYYGQLQIIESLGLRAVEIATHPRDGLSVEALARALARRPIKACLITNFNNPLGACLGDDARQDLLRVLGRRGVPLIEDDIYGELPLAGPRPRAAKAFDRDGLVLYCSSFSKTLAPGFRVGWCAPGRFFDAVRRAKLNTSVASAALPQLAVAEYLQHGGFDHHLRRLRRVYADQVASTAQLIAEHFPAGTRSTRPAGGFVLWVELPARVDALALHRAALAERISIAPGPVFSPDGRYRNFIRLNCGVAWSPAVQQAVITVGRLARTAAAA